MHRQTVEFVITQKKGNITKIGKSSIMQPSLHFSGGSIKWYEDKPKQKSK